MNPIASQRRSLRNLLVLVDVGVVLAALGLTVLERRSLEGWLPLEALPPVAARFPEYAILAVLSLPVWITLAGLLRLHSLFDRAWTVVQLVVTLLQLHALGFVALATMIYATQVVVNRSLLGLFLVNSFALMLLYRLLLVYRRRTLHRRGIGRARLLLVGEPTGRLQSFVQQATGADYPPHVVGFLDAAQSADETGAAGGATGLSRLGTLEQLESVLHDTPVDYVLFFPPFDRADRIERYLLACEQVGVPAMLAIDVGAPSRAVPRLTELCGSPFVAIDTIPTRPDLLAVKHAFDFVLAAAGLLLLAPLLVAIACLVGISMGRPILFVQPRAGYRGRPFRMLKFRTMVVDAEQRKSGLLADNETGGAPFKLQHDPRITRLGRLLRKTSLDELPQLLNVLAGTMSLVGPRPLPLDEQQRIRGWHRRRLAMRPGITGLWQVSGRSNLDFQRWMKLDLEYVDRWSMWLDLKILARTVPVVLFQQGAR